MTAIRKFALPASMLISVLVLAACMTDTRTDIPTTATLQSSGNDRLTFTPQQDGTVWVVNATDNRIVYSGPIAANQAMVVDPVSRAVSVNGKIVADQTVVPGGTRKIYFLPVSAQPTTTIPRSTGY